MTAPARSSPLEVRCSTAPARLDALRPEWSALLDQAGVPSPFLSWEWLATWRRHFGARRPLRILEARDASGALAGLLVLCGRPGLGARRWQLLGNGITGADGLDVLARPAEASAVRAAIAAAALELEGWDALELEDLPCGSPTVAALRAAAAARGVRARVERRFACPGFAVAGSWEAHLRGIRRRETFGRRARWLARQPGFRIEVATRPEEAAAAMADFLRLHRLRWAGEGGSYGIPPGAPEAFHLEVAPLLAARGWLRLYRLLVDGEAIAAVYGLEAGRRFLYYQSGYDPRWSARSPGMVLVGRTVEDAYARGLADYDFLRGEEPYKLDWAADRRETCAVRLRAPSLRAGTAAAAEEAYRAARRLARRVAPERLWGALQRARRAREVNAGAAP
ncbi:cellulose biosynthesis (CelD)-like protein [Anaeromyxobacter sp. K]|uniref:GNAT family N-acetyltransferase n=1 Tax=Anaeromyxobacter sp. (strain K) TaxID=447217 RepID=UPI00015F9A72|nr:GNAT family N-acetyltransferase [Anaeromyxobacter sp. K]ACG73954.1 cellulose biosynthesis (CelD)-like protein [Anaeromyxobacter sp. K]